MKDIIVIQNLQKQGFDFSNIQDVLRYEAVERTPRVFDKAPKRMTMKRATEITEFGCKQEFIMTYNDTLKDLTDGVFNLDFNGVVKYIDKEVYALLQALIKNGITFKERQANACYDLFRIICTAQVDTLTTERVYNTLQPIRPTDYYGKQILEAIKECLFSNDPIALYWGSIANFTGLYKEAFVRGRDIVVEKFKTEKEVDKFVNEQHKLAKADKDFMKSTYTSGVSKALIAIIYYLRNTEPEVLIPDSGKGW